MDNQKGDGALLEEAQVVDLDVYEACALIVTMSSCYCQVFVLGMQDLHVSRRNGPSQCPIVCCRHDNQDLIFGAFRCTSHQCKAN